MLGKFLIVIVVMSGETNAFKLSTVSEITTSVVKKYNIQRVQLLHSQNLPEFEYLGWLKKLLSGLGGTYIATKRMEEIQVLTNSMSSLFLIIAGDENTRTFLSQVRITENSKWLVFLEDSVTLGDYFSEIYIPLSCQFLVAQGDLQVKLTEVYHVYDTGTLQEFHMGKWIADNPVVWSKESLFQRRNNLQGIIIRGTLIPEPPFVTIEKYEDGLPVKISGFCVQVWEMLQNKLNFTIKLKIPDKKVYGSREEDGTWSGMVGEILKNRADIAINLFIMTKSRLSVIDYFSPLFNTKMIVHIQKPEMVSSGFNQVMMQFTPVLWKISIFTIVMLTLLLSACQYITVKYNRQLEYEEFSLKESWIYSIGIFCRQGIVVSSFVMVLMLLLSCRGFLWSPMTRWQKTSYRTPETLSCRLLYLTTHLTAMVMFVAYSANFISFLTNRRPVLPFTDFQSMLQDTTFKLGVIPYSEREAFFKSSTDRILKQVYYQQIKQDKRPRNDQDGLQKMCADPNYGYFCTQLSVKSYTSSLPCVVTGIPEAHFAATEAMAVKKSSPYKKLFSYYLQEMRRNGILKNIEDRFLSEHAEQQNRNHPNVTIETTIVFFYIFTGGAVIANTVLLLEILIYILKRKKKKHTC